MLRHRVTGLGYERRDSEAIDLSPSISCYQVRTDHPNNNILNLAVLLLYHYKWNLYCTSVINITSYIKSI